MIRVIYRWKVEAGKEEQFRAAWKKATTTIRDQNPAARGSFFLQNHQDPTELLTVARWDSFEDWQAFWKGSPPADMQPMRQLAELVSSESFEEIEDHTV